MEASKELEKFREQWRSELKRDKSAPVDTEVVESGKSKTQQNLEQKREVEGGCAWPDLEGSKSRPNAYQPFLLAEDLLKQSGTDNSQQSYREQQPSRKRQLSSTGSVGGSLNLSASFSEDPSQTESQESKRSKPDSSADESFLDIFLQDLEEINEIPFFDCDLPRELALNIFQNLEVEDLCNCAKVSKAWRSLAEDEVLWCKLCRKHGYTADNNSSNAEDWKEIFKQNYSRKQLINFNWRNRTGAFHQLDYPAGGVLCAAHSYDDYVVAGYTGGEVKFWNIANEEECLFRPSSRALVIDESYDQGTITNYVTAVATNKNFTVAGYSQGYVDIWSNETGTSPVHTFRGPETVNQVHLSDNTHQLLVVNNNIARVEHIQNGCWQQQDLFECQAKITHGTFLSHSVCDSHDVILLAMYDNLKLYIPGKSKEEGITIHDTIDQYVTTLDVDNKLIAFTTSCYSEPIPRILLYDAESCKNVCEVHSHAGSVSCLNLKDSPQHMIVTGASDRKAMIHDTRIGETVMTFIRLNSLPNKVQMDDWKVVCGLVDGMVKVYDQRMARELWQFHNRHPVEYLHFNDNILLTANVPSNKFPYTEDYDGLDNIKHRRYRGHIQVYDFLKDQSTQGVHEICLSTYDEPSTYNYNIRLAVPYDNV